MKITTNKQNAEVIITTDECELTIILDGLRQFIPYVKVNNYFDELQIKMVEGMIAQLQEAVEVI